MMGLDTNVVVRYLTQDDPGQCKTVNDLLDTAAGSEEPTFRLNAVVLVEIVWVLDSVYGYGRHEISQALTLLLAVRQIDVERCQAAKLALDAFASGSADFANYFIAILDREAGCETTLTFDKTAARIPGFSLLST